MHTSYHYRLTPSRLVYKVPSKPKSLVLQYQERLAQSWGNGKAQSSLSNLLIKKATWGISDASKRKIFDTLNALYTLSPPRNVKMKTGKEIYNFRASFVTLTLPSSQKHTDIDIKNKCLNQLLIELRKHYKVSNYFWKAELQKNGNIHFHLVLDKYIDYQALRRRWNRCVNKLGYVDVYEAKFAKMSLKKYHNYRNRNAETSFEVSSRGYAAGRKARWRSPNTVDVRVVKNKTDLACYLAKYLAKPVDANGETQEEMQRALDFGRTWARSQSLSQLKFRVVFSREQLSNFIKLCNEQTENVYKAVNEWCTVWYFNIENFPSSVQTWLNKHFRDHASLWGYTLPT